ncbi:MAG: orotidine-5'-phosphate decarboxylase [Rhodospirillaceae bacterium]|nr:orotidine-5'-phosphate decarboxylase [Rhodospirillaceae bacterium]|tara:strand:- start:983 stop:1891 length:909 start_codon:yes stop_codon:yes gene_type:complete
MHFGDRLIKKIRQVGNPLCIGLDPHLEKLPPLFQDGTMEANDPRTAPAVAKFLTTIIDRIEQKVAIIKPQAAFFEKMGWRGFKILDELTQYARRRGILVLLDAKRGDIGSTAKAYSEAYLTDNSAIASDALTVSPFLGRDTLKPYLEAAKTYHSGIFVLVKTSNPGSGDYQDLKIDGKPLYLHICETLKPLAAAILGPITGWSSIGIVVGATYPEQADNLRAALPNVPFLIPGYGAQGGHADDAVRTFQSGPHGPEGGIVNSSRGILFPGNGWTDDPVTWERAFDTGVDQTVDSLKEALARK